MAGDWIKVESVTPDKPEVHAIAEKLGITPEHALGCLIRVWIWADQQSLDGNALSVTSVTLDALSRTQGMAQALCEVGWAKKLSTGYCLPHFDRHNGKTAKDRALMRKRGERFRNAASVTNALPEKRRVLPTNGVDVMKLAGEPKPETQILPKRGESAEEFERRKTHGDPPHVTPQTAAQSLARANQALSEIRNAPAEPMSEAAKQAVEKLRKAARIADTSDPPPIEPDDIPFDRNEPEPLQAGANP